MCFRMNCDIAKHYVQLCSSVIKNCEDRKLEFMQLLSYCHLKREVLFGSD